VLGVLLLVAGCGSEGRSAPEAHHPAATACAGATGPFTLGRIDVNGDGKPDDLTFYGAADEPGDDCFTEDTFVVSWANGGGDVYYERNLPLEKRDVSAVTLPGRRGSLVLVVQSHPRGGFVAHLTAADGKDTVEVGGAAGLIPFVATDAPTGHVAARCTATGFDVIEAVAHTPIGVVPAWDVYRTSYGVDGSRLVAGPRTEIADNVLDKQLRASYRDVVAHRLFAGCRG
jgi:hypothetical protein